MVAQFKRIDFKDVEISFKLFSLKIQRPEIFEIGKGSGTLKVVDNLPTNLTDDLEGTESVNNYSMIVFASSNRAQSRIADYQEVIISIKKDYRNKGPKISQASCGNITLPENVSISNFSRIVVLENRMTNTKISYKIEGKHLVMNSNF